MNTYTEPLEALMRQVLKPDGEAPIFHCLLRVNDGKRDLQYEGAVGNTQAGDPVSASSGFRTGSITKPFTAVLVLQLMEQGLFQLDDPLFELLDDKARKDLTRLHVCEGVEHSGRITVQHLLQHRSGLRDYFADDERFLAGVMEHHGQQWDKNRILDRYFAFGLNEKASFAPGEGFYYSDTNYVLLGWLVEHQTGKPLHEQYEERILAPLGLKDTYLEFFQAPKGEHAILYPWYGPHSLRHTNTSFDWGGGGLVSSMRDLEVFIRALAGGTLFGKADTLTAMTRFELADSAQTSARRSVHYGLGLQKKAFPGYAFLGHNSAYASAMYYDPEKDLSIVMTLNQAGAVHKAEWLLHKTAGLLQE